MGRLNESHVTMVMRAWENLPAKKDRQSAVLDQCCLNLKTCTLCSTMFLQDFVVVAESDMGIDDPEDNEDTQEADDAKSQSKAEMILKGLQDNFDLLSAKLGKCDAIKLWAVL